jgi:NAD(P)-dependent dehydrogenase (short-subunit alcohol dehydrogenase family)
MPQVQGKKRKVRPEQHQDKQPGLESSMKPRPVYDDRNYKGSGKLKGCSALITGGDSGIGRAVAVAFAKEGADIAIVYLDEHSDAEETRREVEGYGRKCILLPGDAGNRKFCDGAVKKTVKAFGRLDVLVNNAAVQYPTTDIQEISEEQLEKTFRTNIFSFFFMVQAALKHLESSKGRIVNSTSVTAYRGSHHLLDYSSTKGAIVSFTRSLSQALVKKDVRVNAVAPGPVWTPLIPSSMDARQSAEFGSDAPMERAAQPYELAPSYVFLASSDSSCMTGQVLHPNGGEIING